MTTLTPEEWRKMVLGKKKNKFNAQKTIVNGIAFASKLEAALYVQLVTLLRGGVYYGLELQPSVQLLAKNGNKYRYKPDFKAWNSKTREPVWFEAKGMEGQTYLRNRACWKFSGPGRLEVWKRSREGLYLAEVVTPAIDARKSSPQPS